MPVPRRSTALARPRRSGRALVCLPLGLILVITVVDILSPPSIHLGPLLVVAPALTASFAGARLTALVSAIAVAALFLIGVLHGGLTTSNHESQIVALVVVSALVVAFRALRERHARELTQVRSVSETAQRVLLRPLPTRIGPLRIASIYLAAEAEAQIGGDLYAASRTVNGTRLIVGDVRGKGLTSLGEAALLLGAFRAAAHLQASLPELAAYLDGSVSWDLAAAADGDPPDEDETSGPVVHDAAESFITAVILDIPDDGSQIQIINCGHPPPLLLHHGRVATLEVRRPAPPLGLGGLLETQYQADSFPFSPSDRLLLYTDGVIEARDEARSFYPLTERIRAWTSERPAALLQHLHRDLLEHAGGRLGDDAAMVAVERVPKTSRR
ncbi:serine/threonine-protein phosphatase [Kitasatospora sp. RB6PN24]|uniref:PP2C family protein-serine/threonine phosphatase n=1 Tax=Kitasatospora humi TaxID=2893891 RepID=UPI001E3A9B7B|nr:PP2C family protein-serine/threonine phosphatase [Kitasatospora humi]MCC9309830.1 serine/threonine-protein phosphatase [Kitasatospora humi]